MQQNNVKRFLPKIMSIYVPNLVTHTASDFWDSLNSIRLKVLNLKASTTLLYKSCDKDFSYDFF